MSDPRPIKLTGGNIKIDRMDTDGTLHFRIVGWTQRTKRYEIHLQTSELAADARLIRLLLARRGEHE